MSSFTVDYWLERCEGFRVDAPEGRVGFVEAVLISAETGHAATLLVRGGTPVGLVAVAVDEIDDVALNEEHIVLRPARARVSATLVRYAGFACSQCGRPAPADPGERAGWTAGGLLDPDDDVAAAILLCPDCRAEDEAGAFEEGGGD